MLFNFALVPINEFQPWGKPGALHLHWFGLTDSEYGIAFGGSKLLEFSEEARLRGATQFCDHQVARLYEDSAISRHCRRTDAATDSVHNA
jgi:hypothetical protein